MRFDFQREDGTLCAAGYMKGAAARRAGLVPNPESYARLGHAFESLPLPVAIDHWSERVNDFATPVDVNLVFGFRLH
jgi:hypothetical protein